MGVVNRPVSRSLQPSAPGAALHPVPAPPRGGVPPQFPSSSVITWSESCVSVRLLRPKSAESAWSDRVSPRAIAWFLAATVAALFHLPDAGAAPFVCGGTPKEAGVVGASGELSAAEGHRSALVIFSKFRGESPADSVAPSYSEGFFDEGLPGSFSHFYSEMSFGRLKVSGSVLRRVYESNGVATQYTIPDPETGLGEFGRYNAEVLRHVDAEIDLGRFDSDGPDGFPNSGDDDGYVDFIFINLLSVPKGFFIGSASGFASLGLADDLVTNDPARAGGRIRIHGMSTGQAGTTQRVTAFSDAVGSMAHEFAHTLGLMDLFDQSFLRNTGQDLSEDSAGIGAWDLMSRGALGWNGAAGPNAFSAYCREFLGWIGKPGDPGLIEVSGSLSSQMIGDVETGGAVYKLRVSDDEYFLVENRQKDGGHYDRNIPAGGLLIWHVDTRARGNDEEYHKRVDLEVASGLFDAAGGSSPGEGQDNLDRWSRDQTYAAAHNGDLGRATDVFDGIRFTDFAGGTNPNSDAYSGLSQRTATGLAVRRIHRSGSTMIADLLVHEASEGRVFSDTTWSGNVRIDADLVIDRGVTLSIDRGTVVSVGASDAAGRGIDKARCEITVFGQLRVTGAGISPVTFRPARGVRSNWSGIRLVSGQTNLDLRDLAVANSDYGVSSSVYTGQTVWQGAVAVSEDIVIPAGAQVTVKPGTSISFGPTDISGRGIDPRHCELTVEGRLVVEASSSSTTRFTLSRTARSGDYWYGIVVSLGGSVEISSAAFDDAAIAVSGDAGQRPSGIVPVQGSARPIQGREGDVVLQDCIIAQGGIGVRLKLAGGLLEVRGSTVHHQVAEGIQVSGYGTVSLSGTTVADNLGHALSVDFCDVKASGCGFVRSGVSPDTVLEGMSGVRAIGGSSSRLEFVDCRFEGNSGEGMNLSGWTGSVLVQGGSVSSNASNGILAVGVSSLDLDNCAIGGNGADGLNVKQVLQGQETGVSIRRGRFTGDSGWRVASGEGVTGIVEKSLLSGGGHGLKLDHSGSWTLRENLFSRLADGVVCLSSPAVMHRNRFQDDVIAVSASGRPLPSGISGNSFIGTGIAVQNTSPDTLNAAGNWWGTVDESVVRGAIVGPVIFIPLLLADPSDTSVSQTEEETAIPTRAEIEMIYPNPFNAQASIVYAVPLSMAGLPLSLDVFDLAGQHVRSIVASTGEAGRHRVVWDATDGRGRSVASGVYVMRMLTGDALDVRKALLVR